MSIKDICYKCGYVDTSLGKGKCYKCYTSKCPVRVLGPTKVAELLRQHNERVKK